MSSLKSLAVVATLAMLAIVPVAHAGQLTVSGQSTIETIPDMAVITLGVEKQGRTAQGALSENNAAMAELLAVLDRAGIERRDIQTHGLMLDPQYSRQTNNSVSQINGYIARNQVQVRVRQLGELGSVLDAAIRAGGNRFYGLSFGVQDAAPHADQALRDAIADARSKALLMADAAGVSLGPIIEMHQSNSGSRPMPLMREMAAMSDAVPVSEGSVGITATVTIVYEIE